MTSSAFLPNFSQVMAGRAAFALAATVAAFTVAAQPNGGDDELAAKATDPTAALMSFQLYDWRTTSHHGIDDPTNQVVFRAAIPFDLAGTQHIFRVTQPFATSSLGGATGMVDTTVFDLMAFSQPWGRWGLGISGTLPTGRDGLSTEKWTAGPAAGFVNSSDKRNNWGLFAQSFFSFAGEDSAARVGIVSLQPIYSHQLGSGRSISLGNSGFVYDTAKSRWASLMLGANYGMIVTVAGHKWRPNIELDYDFKDERGNPKWVVRAGFALLLPTP